MHEHDRTPFCPNDQELFIGLQLGDMEWKCASESVLACANYPEVRGNRLSGLAWVENGSPEFEVLMGIVSVSPKELPEREI